jgi:hypothetical protein
LFLNIQSVSLKKNYISLFRLFPDGGIEITEGGESLNVSSENFCVNFAAFSDDGLQLTEETFFICVEDNEEVTK